MHVATKDRVVKSSAWLLYALIVLEILFMVSPFAAYYYSIYATPLNALQASPHSAWLTMYILPHFTYSDSWLANGLILISWPLILTGIVLFAFGFCQIYWSKFTRKGAVEVGLYRFIRHPQYVALAVIGLGTSLYWSRFIVVVAYVSMLCIYYFLARVEERVCLAKFGASYRDYMDRTGMFLPQHWEAWWRSSGLRLPRARRLRAAILTGLYAMVMALTIGASQLLRNHVIDSLQIELRETRVTVFLAPVGPQKRKIAVDLLDAAALPGNVAYVAPSSWWVPELGFSGSSERDQGGGMSELMHPTTHGNPLSFDQGRLSVLLVESISAGHDVQGIERFSHALGIRPIELVVLDLVTGEIVERGPAVEGGWAGIPVPTF